MSEAAAREASVRLQAWLFEHALPLWWERGADRQAGGYHDRLGLDGKPVAGGARRVRVQARQAFVYAMAHRLGWEGPAGEAHRHGMAALRRLRCADGLFRTAPDAPGALDGMGLLYDQAFALLAFSSAHAGFDEANAEAEAVALVGRLAPFRHPLGGYAEAPGHVSPLFANPNMHLFESFQAWSAASPGPAWRALAAMERDLAVGRLIDGRAGVLGERFGPDWSPPSEAGDRVVWPGHLYEWAWLLLSWGEGGQDLAAALRLIEVAEAVGVDRGSGVVYFSLGEALSPLDAGGRLWAQTERLRACAAAAARTGDVRLWEAAAQAAEVMWRFFETPTRGLWRDRIDARGVFQEEPAPASSLYHVAGAIEGLACQLEAPARNPLKGGRLAAEPDL